VVTEYSDPEGGLLHDLALLVLDRYSGRQLAQLLGTDRRTIDRVRRGASPRHELREILTELAVSTAREDLESAGVLDQDVANTLPAQILAGWNGPGWKQGG
jgi:hypothetical protein